MSYTSSLKKSGTDFPGAIWEDIWIVLYSATFKNRGEYTMAHNLGSIFTCELELH